MKSFSKFIKRRKHEEALFWWITALRSNFTSFTIEQCVLNFFHYNKITEEEWDLKAALTVYNRMQNEFIDDQKDPNKKLVHATGTNKD